LDFSSCFYYAKRTFGFANLTREKLKEDMSHHDKSLEMSSLLDETQSQ